MRNRSFLALLLAVGACRAGASSSPQPDTATDEWRKLVGCYQIGRDLFSLDSVPGTRSASAAEPGVRRARFVPHSDVAEAYWFVTSRGTLWVVSHEGWGVTYELVQRGDILVGSQHLHSHVVGSEFSPTPVSAVRAAGCPAEPQRAAGAQP
jgi:hypothetical protein